VPVDLAHEFAAVAVAEVQSDVALVEFERDTRTKLVES
jgi:hypothetical protein